MRTNYHFIIYLWVVISASPTTFAKGQLKPSKLKIELQSINDTKKKSGHFSVKIYNTSDKQIAIVKPNLKFPLSFNNNTWNAQVYYRDSIRRPNSSNIHVDYHLSKEDYIQLEPQRVYEFLFEISIDNGSDIHYPDDDSNQHPLHIKGNPGMYSIQVLYSDPIRRHRRAVKGRIESNRVKIHLK